MKWNPRYLAYCKAHGRTPEAMMAHDDEQWKGGRMCGFLLWHSERLNEARREHREFFFIQIGGIPGTLVDHKGYDRWLNAWSADECASMCCRPA